MYDFNREEHLIQIRVDEWNIADSANLHLALFDSARKYARNYNEPAVRAEKHDLGNNIRIVRQI